MSERQPPYPADTRAKGWRFELDYEKIDQSDTWGLAAEVPLARACLVMMWLVAWTQEPCGSLPNDEAIIRARCGIPASSWPKVRELLMRGWWLATDGRLYHDTLVKRAIEMMAKRRSDSDRQAAKRAREALESSVNTDGVTRESRVTTGELHRESGTDHRVPKKRLSKPTASHPPAGGFDEFWLAWPKNERKQDKAKCAAFWRLHSLDAVALVITADVRTKRGTQKWSEGFIEAPLVYLRGRRWEDGVTPNDGESGVGEWHETGGGIKAKGAELGIPYTAEDDCRPFDVYRSRVFNAAGHSPRAAA